MKLNKKIFCALVVLIIFLSVNSISAADNVSDIMASDNSGFDSGISTSPNENLELTSTIVVTNETFNNYFTNATLNDNVGAGSTLDFQGTFTGTDYKVNITKPVNIISSTGDALFNEIGKKDTTGGCFHISAGGSGTNVTGLKFINSAFYVTGAENVVIDTINMMADMNGVGSGTGFMCVQAGSRYVTVKDSYFENRGTGSSIIVIGYSDYCTVDNNEVVINGSSGNAIYITTFVPAGYKGNNPTGNIISNNYVHGEASGFCMALVVAGESNFIENNIIDYNGASGIASQSFSTPNNNTYINNVLTGGCSFAAAENSYVSGNKVDGAMSTGSNSVLKDNEMKSLSLAKPNVVVDNNIIGASGVTVDKDALNTTFTNNFISSRVDVKSNNNTIKGNTIQTDDAYAIDLFTTTGNEVSDNYLSSNNSTGNDAVKTDSGNNIHDNNESNIVTNDNFFDFFDASGNYKHNYTKVFFSGEFDSLVDAITINKPLSIQGINASLKNMAFNLVANNITLNTLTMELSKAPTLTNGSAISIKGIDNTIERMSVGYALNEASNAYIIHAEEADNLILSGNDLFFNGNTDLNHINNIIYVSESSGVFVNHNIIGAILPSCYVDWKEIPPASGTYVKFPVSEGLVFKKCSNLSLSDNNININYDDIVGDADSIYVIDITDSKDVEVFSNNITAMGHTYIYGIYVESEGLLIDSNNLNIQADNNYANGIEIEASKNAVVSNNNFDVSAPNFSYPIYSGMNGGDLEVNYTSNMISALADIVYGMELCGNIENVYNNTINVFGNKTTALAINSKKINISGNVINAFGYNLGNSSSVDIFAPLTASINLINSTVNIEDNIIFSRSIGIIAQEGVIDISDNEIEVKDNGLDNSYGIAADDSVISINNNKIVYEGNTNGSTINNAVSLNDCSGVQINGNDFNITIPSAYVKWVEFPPGSGNYVKAPISEGLSLNECMDLTLTDNVIDLKASSVVGDYDTIYVIDITDSANAYVAGNNISALGHDYIYGLYIESDDGIVDSNNFMIKSDTNYANAIEIEASVDATISNNYMNVTAPNVVYSVYSGMNGGDLEVDYIDNVIDAYSDIVYGMELCGSVENVIDNRINVNGNQTTGIAVKSIKANISNNIINALGLNLNNASTTDYFKSMTVGINLYNSTATIELNNIISSSRGILAENGIFHIENNILDIHDNAFADSFAIMAQESGVCICENEIYYEGNTTGATKNKALYLKDCTGADVHNNIFNISIPSCYVDWKEVPPGSGNWVSDPISEGICIDSDETSFINNDVTVDYNGIVDAYDTIYAVHIISDNCVIDSNNIKANGHSYLYALEVTGDNLTIENNEISAESDEFYANGINVEGPGSCVIKNNNISAVAPGVTYGIYSSMSHGNVSVDYSNNLIISEAPLAYGMELRGLKEKVDGNSFIINGETGVGILSSSKDVTVTGNDFDVNANSKTSSAFIGVSGNATITDNTVLTGGEYAVDVLNITALVKDNYLIAANLTGDDAVNYNPKTSSVYNNTPKQDEYSIISEGLDKYYGNSKALEFTLIDSTGKGVANQTISILINGKSYNRVTNANGTASININLPSGNYTVTATYGNVSGDASVIILSTVGGKDITKIFKNATQYEAIFVDSDGNVLQNKMVQFNINGVVYNRETDANGIAKLNINLPQGEYIITAINTVNGEMHANNITVLPNIADNKDIIKYYKNGTQYSVKLLGSDGKAVGAGEKVTFNVNGVFYTRQTDASGIATITINLPPSNYVITADYNGCRVANNITVLPVLNATDLKMKYKDGSQFKANLVDGQGKPYAGQTIQFNVNGVLYNRVTDSTGQAALNINLPSGEYIITSSYNGSNIANKITITG